VEVDIYEEFDSESHDRNQQILLR